MTEQQIEIAAAEAGLEIARVIAFRRESGNAMTGPEQEVWEATMRFAHLIATQAAPAAASTKESAS